MKSSMNYKIFTNLDHKSFEEKFAMRGWEDVGRKAVEKTVTKPKDCFK